MKDHHAVGRVVLIGYLAAAIYVLLLAVSALALKHAKQGAAYDQHTGADQREPADDLSVSTIGPQTDRREYRCCATTHIEQVSHRPSLVTNATNRKDMT